MTFLSWLQAALHEAAERDSALTDAREGRLLTQSVGVVSHLAEPYTAFLRDGGLAPTLLTRPPGARPIVAVQLEPLLPPLDLPLSAHASGTSVGAVNDALRDAMRWAADAIGGVKDALAQTVLGQESRATATPCPTVSDHACAARGAAPLSAPTIPASLGGGGGGAPLAAGSGAASAALEDGAAADASSSAAPPSASQGAATDTAATLVDAGTVLHSA